MQRWQLPFMSLQRVQEKKNVSSVLNLPPSHHTPLYPYQPPPLLQPHELATRILFLLQMTIRRFYFPPRWLPRIGRTAATPLGPCSFIRPAPGNSQTAWKVPKGGRKRDEKKKKTNKKSNRVEALAREQIKKEKKMTHFCILQKHHLEHTCSSSRRGPRSDRGEH